MRGPPGIRLYRLRSLLLAGGDGEWHQAHAPFGLDQPLTLVPQSGSLLDSGLLPEPGFLLAAAQDEPDVAPAERIRLVGSLEKADLISGWWRLSTEQGPCTGRVKTGGPTLAGLQLGGRYHFVCLPGVDELAGSGRERRTLFSSSASLSNPPSA